MKIVPKQAKAEESIVCWATHRLSLLLKKKKKEIKKEEEDGCLIVLNAHLSCSVKSSFIAHANNTEWIKGHLKVLKEYIFITVLKHF